jgi:hypothetical protein
VQAEEVHGFRALAWGASAIHRLHDRLHDAPYWYSRRSSSVNVQRLAEGRNIFAAIRVTTRRGTSRWL